LEEKYGIAKNRYVVGDWRSDIEWWHRAWAKTIWFNYLNKTKVNDEYLDFEIKSLQEIQDIL
jgi:FMN phosphatase YigB (HAD superfamily)